MLAVFGHGAPGVVALPESAVEDRGEPLLQPGGQGGGVGARFDGAQRLVVTRHHALDVFRAAGASFDLQHPDARADEPVEEIDRAEVFGREDVTPVDVQRRTGLRVRDGVFATA